MGRDRKKIKSRIADLRVQIEDAVEQDTAESFCEAAELKLGHFYTF